MPAPTNGLRYQISGQEPIYFTLDGKYRRVPDMTTYVRLWPHGGHVEAIADIPAEFLGTDLPTDTDVFKGTTQNIYFYSNAKKRLVVNWSFYVKAFGTYRSLPDTVINDVPNDTPPTIPYG